MKHLKTILITAAAVGLGATSINSSAASNCATCGGWFYTAQQYTGNYSYNYDSRGPFSTEEACNLARNADFGDGDTWLPSESLGNGCSWRFETDYAAYEEIFDSYNLASPGGNGGTGYGDTIGALISDKELIRDITTLRDVFEVDAYESKLESMIVDPNNDEDSARELKR
ncbi:hypothetical protein [Kangiella marina]|uniref:Uncharacterized protein n=1 Tax=Kangiella marina TaxID=1079178 RepID=A0ABP8IQJ9_9GAMM